MRTTLLVLLLLAATVGMVLAAGPAPDYNANPRAYAEWKAGLARESHTLEGMDITKENDYISVLVGTSYSYGDYNEGGRTRLSDTRKRISYAWPGSPSTGSEHYWIDGTVYETDGGGAATAFDETDSSAWVLFAGFHGVNIMQTYTIKSMGRNPGDIEEVLFKTVITSADGLAHVVGCIIHVDTMVGDNDACRVATSMGFSGTATRYVAPDMPSIWRAYEFGAPPASTGLASLGILRGFEAVEPDVFYLGQWSLSATAHAWNDATWPTGTPYTDSATLTKWRERDLAAGDSLVFATYYGVGKTEIDQSISMEHNPPVIGALCDVYVPDTVHITSVISNWGADSISDIVLSVQNLTRGLTIGGAGPTHTIGTLLGWGGGTVIEFPAILARNAENPPCYDLVFQWDSVWADTSMGWIWQEPFDTNGGFTPDPASGGWSFGDFAGETGWGFSLGSTASWNVTSPWVSLPPTGPGGCSFLVLDIRHQFNLSDGQDGVYFEVTQDGTRWVGITPIGGYLGINWMGDSVFTGTSGGTVWIHNDFDLSDFAASNIRIRAVYAPGYMATGSSYSFSEMQIACGVAEESHTIVTATTHYCMTVNDLGSMVVAASVSQSICQEPGSFATLAAEMTGAGAEPPFTYQWSPAAGLNDPTVASPEAAPETTSLYTVLVTAQNGCTSYDTITVIVNPKPRPSVSTDSIFVGQTAILRATVIGHGPFSYTWTGGGSNADTLAVTDGGTYWVRVQDGMECSDSANGSAVVFPVPELTLPDSHEHPDATLDLSWSIVDPPINGQLDFVVSMDNAVLEPISLMGDPILTTLGWGTNYQDSVHNGMLYVHLTDLTPELMANLPPMRYHVPATADGGMSTNIILESGTAAIGSRAFTQIRYIPGFFFIDPVPVAWTVDLRFSPTNPSMRYQTLTLGMAVRGTDGFDVGIDRVYVPPPSNQQDAYFRMSDPAYPVYTSLARDIRHLGVLHAVWVAYTFDQAGTLSWVTSALPPGQFMINGLVDMRVDSTFHYGVGDTVVIEYSFPELNHQRLTIRRGWNLLGISGYLPNQDVSFVFPWSLATYKYTMEAGYVPVTRVSLGTGYWVLADVDTLLDLTLSVPAGIRWNLNKGWSLIAGPLVMPNCPIADMNFLPPGSMVNAYEMRLHPGTYDGVTAATPGYGVWILFTRPVTGHWEVEP